MLIPIVWKVGESWCADSFKIIFYSRFTASKTVKPLRCKSNKIMRKYEEKKTLLGREIEKTI